MNIDKVFDMLSDYKEEKKEVITMLKESSGFAYNKDLTDRLRQIEGALEALERLNV